MSATVTFDDNGVLRALSKLAVALRHPSQGLRVVGADVLDEVRPLVPVDTGRLVDDLRAGLDRDGVTVSIGETPRVGDYAAIINARAHFIPTDAAVEAIAVPDLDRAIDDLIRGVGLS